MSLSRVVHNRGEQGCGTGGRQDRETTLSRNPRRLHKTRGVGYREKGTRVNAERGVKYERRLGTGWEREGGRKGGEAANG